MTDKPTTRMTSAQAWELYHLLVDAERCDRAIREYAEAGIAGTSHDIEHREMRDQARARATEIING